MKNIKQIIVLVSFVISSTLIQAGPLDIVPSEGSENKFKNVVYDFMDLAGELKKDRETKENEKILREKKLNVLRRQIIEFLTQQIIPRKLLEIYFDCKKNDKIAEDFFTSSEAEQKETFLKVMRPYLEQLEVKQRKPSQLLHSNL